jgi:hypothetical protein
LTHEKDSWTNWDFIARETFEPLCDVDGSVQVRLSLRVLSQDISDKQINKNVSPKGAKVSKHDTVETRVFNGWLIKNRGKALSEEIADELVKAFNLVPNFDVSKVGPTKYLRNQVTELYMPQCVWLYRCQAFSLI